MFDVHGFEMTIFKLLIGIILIVLHLRLTGKQQTTQMTPIDFIGNFILGGIIGGVIYNHAISFAEYVSFLLVAFAIISGLNYAMSKVGEGGVNHLLVSNGQVVADNLELAGHSEEWLRGELEQAGITDLDGLFLVELDAADRLNIVNQEGQTTSVRISGSNAQEVTTVTEFQAPQERSATLEDVIPEDARADAAESDG